MSERIPTAMMGKIQIRFLRNIPVRVIVRPARLSENVIWAPFGRVPDAERRKKFNRPERFIRGLAEFVVGQRASPPDRDSNRWAHRRAASPGRGHPLAEHIFETMATGCLIVRSAVQGSPAGVATLSSCCLLATRVELRQQRFQESCRRAADLWVGVVRELFKLLAGGARFGAQLGQEPNRAEPHGPLLGSQFSSCRRGCTSTVLCQTL